MFINDEWRTKYAGWYDVYALIVGFYSGWCISVGCLDAISCRSLSDPVIIIASLLLLAVMALSRLRIRTVSLQSTRELISKILIATFAVLASFVTVAYVIKLCISLKTGLNDSGCSMRLLGTSISILPLSLVWSVFNFLFVFAIVYSRTVFMVPEPENFGRESHQIEYIRTSCGHLVPTIFYRCPSAQYTIVYSHGNAVDLGSLLNQGKLRGLRDELRVNVVGYDYPGYGYSAGTVGENECFDALESVYKYVTKRFQIPSSQIILYGRSMGSGPTVHLAAKCGSDPDALAGLILESPLLSVLRTLGKWKFIVKCRRFDKFVNIDKLHEIVHPVFVAHGLRDTVVPHWHGEETYNRINATEKEKIWLPDVGHNDMPEVYSFRDLPMQVNEDPVEYKKKQQENIKCNKMNREFKDRLLSFISNLASNQAKRNSTSETKNISTEKTPLKLNSHNEILHDDKNQPDASRTKKLIKKSKRKPKMNSGSQISRTDSKSYVEEKSKTFLEDTSPTRLKLTSESFRSPHKEREQEMIIINVPKEGGNMSVNT